MKLTAILLLILIFSNISYGSDTLATKVKEEVIVEAEKEPFWVGKTLSYYKFEIKEENLLFFHNTSEVLSYFPNVYIRDYGGLGGIKTISLRGYSAPDVGILLDGFKINSQQNGIVDLNLLPLESFETIELVRGGSSFLNGNNFASGFVNFSMQNTTKRTASFSIGSFEQIKITANIPYKFNHSNNAIFGVTFFSTDGKFPFEINNFGKTEIVRRENGWAKILSTFLVNNTVIKQIVGKISILYTNSVRGVPGAVVQNSIENKNAKLTEDMLFASIRLNPLFLDSSLQVGFKTLLHNSYYFDPEMNSLLINKETANYFNKDFEIKFLYRKPIWGFQVNSFIETNYSTLSGDFLEQNSGNSVERINFALGFGFGKTFSLARYIFNLETNFRFDAFSKIQPVYVYSFGVSFEDTLIATGTKFNFSKNFRLPTFNEMYFLNYGNKNLRPEETFALNLEFYNNFFPFFQPKFTIFYYYTTDKIISVPKSPVQWTAKNIAKAQSSGVEISVNSQNIIFDATFSFSFTKAIDKSNNSPTSNKQLVYTPKQILTLLLHFPLPLGFSYTSKILYVGKRFALPDNSNNSKLDPYLLLDLSIQKEFTSKNFKTIINFEISNILNSRYEIIVNYPMPKRYFLISFKTIF